VAYPVSLIAFVSSRVGVAALLSSRHFVDVNAHVRELVMLEWLEAEVVLQPVGHWRVVPTHARLLLIVEVVIRKDVFWALLHIRLWLPLGHKVIVSRRDVRGV
jgi:hypothetical protein